MVDAKAVHNLKSVIHIHNPPSAIRYPPFSIQPLDLA